MKRLVLIPLMLATTAQAEITWKQTAGITCLASAGLVAATHPKAIYDRAVSTKNYVKKHPDKVVIGLSTIAFACLASRETVNGFNSTMLLVQRVRNLLNLR